ncbi:hypothetical protein PG995_010847 [Apiospora arundinis]
MHLFSLSPTQPRKEGRRMRGYAERRERGWFQDIHLFGAFFTYIHIRPAAMDNKALFTTSGAIPGALLFRYVDEPRQDPRWERTSG